MKPISKIYFRVVPALLLIIVLAIAWPVSAAVFNLRAGATVVHMPDGTPVTMWGFGLEGGQITVPGPLLRVPPGDSTLTIHLTNDLPEPVSLFIPGQAANLSPVKFTDGEGRTRVRSFTQETAPGSTSTYVWNSVRSGTFIYQSGTHMAVQVQMGLYGALVKEEGMNTAYPGRTYHKEMVLLLSEIDPALHNAVATGAYGSPAYPSTINYKPKYFLINGQPFPSALPILNGFVGAGEDLLVRILNCGLKSHVLLFGGKHLSIIAEDGNLFGHEQNRSAVFMPAGKTKDVIISINETGEYAIYDRMFSLTNNDQSPGGMLTYFEVVAACVWDYDNDKDVDGADLAAFQSDFAAGIVGMADLAEFGASFGRNNCP